MWFTDPCLLNTDLETFANNFSAPLPRPLPLCTTLLGPFYVQIVFASDVSLPLKDRGSLERSLSTKRHRTAKLMLTDGWQRVAAVEVRSLSVLDHVVPGTKLVLPRVDVQHGAILLRCNADVVVLGGWVASLQSAVDEHQKRLLEQLRGRPQVPAEDVAFDPLSRSATNNFVIKALLVEVVETIAVRQSRYSLKVTLDDGSKLWSAELGHNFLIDLLGVATDVLENLKDTASSSSVAAERLSGIVERVGRKLEALGTQFFTLCCQNNGSNQHHYVIVDVSSTEPPTR